MKEYIKKFNTLVSANNYDIADIPFTSTLGEGNFINLVCNTPNKRIIVKDNKIDFSTVITGTWDPSLTDKTSKVIISGNVTLNGKTDCYSLTFEDGGHLTINAGARLRVWEGGITNNDCTTVNYLTIIEDFANDGYAEFLLHPDVTVNNHPLASVYSKFKQGKDSQGNYIYTRFGISTQNPATSVSPIPSPPPSIWVHFFNKQAYKWETVNNVRTDVYQFESYTNSYDLQSEFTMIYTGFIIGNLNQQITITRGYNALSNGYLGKLNIYELRKSLPDLDQNFGTIYSNITCPQTEITVDITNKFVNCLGAYILRLLDVSTLTMTLNYKDLVWDPSFEEEVTSTRSLMKGALTSSKPSEIDTTLEGSGIFDNPDPIFPTEPIE